MEKKKLPQRKIIIKPKSFDPKAFLKDFVDFSEKINDDLLCAICYNLLYKPTILTCKHRFCLPCMERWYNKETEDLQCPLCQRAYPLTTKFSVDINLEKEIKQEYDKEYKLLSEYKKWEFDTRSFNEIKWFYGNTFALEGGKRKWTFFFKLKEGMKNDYIDKIVLKINANSEGVGGQTAEITKYPFRYSYIVNNSFTGGFYLMIYIHWKKEMGTPVTRINYEIVLAEEGKMLSYLFKQELKKKGKKRV